MARLHLSYRGARRVVALALAAALLGGGLDVQQVAAADPVPTTTYLQFDPEPQLPYTYFRLHGSVFSATVGSDMFPRGSIEFYETIGATDVLLGSALLSPSSIGYSAADIYVSTFGAGVHHLYAKYVGPDPNRATGTTSATQDLTVLMFTPNVSLQNNAGDPVETNHSFTLSSWITDAGDQYPSGGATVTFTRVGSAAPICVVTPAYPGPTECVVPSQPVGTWQYRATYTGNSDTNAASSSDLTVHVVADTVHATGVGLQYTTFYPYKDSYRDTVAIRGTRAESIGVSIKVYSPAGTLLKTVSIAAGTGAYSYAWSGRNSSGTIYAEGKYKVVQVLKDAAGTTLTSTGYVTLSKKKLYSYTKTITKTGSSVSARGSEGGGTTTLNTTSGYAKVYAPAESFSWAGVGWQFTLPSASVYNWFYVRIYGRHSGGPGVSHIGAQRFTTCPYSSTATWYETCFNAWATVPVTSGTTLYYYRTPGLTSDYRSGTTVRLMMSTTGGTIYAYKAELRVSYGILKY